MVFDLAADFSAAIGGMPADRPLLRILRLLEEALRRDIHFIARHPTTLFQCMWNLCWWYDCTQAAQHYHALDSESRWGSLPWNQAGPKLCNLADRWRTERERSASRFLWLRSLRPPAVGLGRGQRAVLRGHESVVSCVLFSPDGRLIISGAGDGSIRVWDVHTGQKLYSLHEKDAQITCLAVSHDGLHIAAGANNGFLGVWDTATGTRRLPRGKPGPEVIAASFSPTGQQIAWVGYDKALRILDAQTGDQCYCFRSAKITSQPA